MTKTPAAVGALVACLGGSGCASGGGPDPDRARAANDESPILSRDARLAASHRAFTLLTVPNVGRVLVTCDRRGRSKITFRSSFFLPTSDVLVDVAGRGPIAATIQPKRTLKADRTPRTITHQTWHIAPFASARVRLTMLSITTQAVHEHGTIFGCAASAMAIVGQDQGPTATR